MLETRRMKAKVALIGESAVGKTSLIRRFVKDEFEDKYLHTVGTKVTKIELVVPHGDVEVLVDLVVFDIMGQKGFLELVRESFFEGCQGLVAVCDVTRKETLAAIHDWMSAATGVAGDVPAVLLVNKIDLADHHRDFPFPEVERIAQAWEMPHASTSAKTGAGVDDAFSRLALEMVAAAFRETEAHSVETDLRHKVLRLVARRGSLGVPKGDFFAVLKGVSYTELERELSALERDSLVEIAWMGPADFTVRITRLGEKATAGA